MSLRQTHSPHIQLFDRKFTAETRQSEYVTLLGTGAPRRLSFKPMGCQKERCSVFMKNLFLLTPTRKTRLETGVYRRRNPRRIQFGKNLINKIKQGEGGEMVPEGLQGERTPQGRRLARLSRTRCELATPPSRPAPLCTDGKPQAPAGCYERARELLAGLAHEYMQSKSVSRASPNS